jgi:hypothetical protein
MNHTKPNACPQCYAHPDFFFRFGVFVGASSDAAVFFGARASI